VNGLQEFEFKIATFFEMTPDLVCIAGRDGFFKKVNQAVVKKLGYTEAELMGSPISAFMHPDDRHITLHKRSELLNGKALVNFQNRYVKKDGSFIWLEWTSIYFSDGQVVFAIAKDITERKQIEIEVEEKYQKFKGLATHFKTSIEEDRKYLANELHEELAQLASVLKSDIEWIGRNAPDWSPSSRGRIDHAMVISNHLIKTIRRISFSISPNMLEHLGLNATLEWHCKEFTILNGIPCRFECTYDDSNLSDEIRIDLFRICQEALTNILTHAEASHVTIRIEEMEGQIRLTILDDGKGFAVDQQKRRPGLIRMRERAASINGLLTIQSRAGEGTTICVTIAK
jgi:PAS domain S-box-containing protein